MQLIRNFAVIGILTIGSRVSGMIREIFISYLLGATWISDAFVVALRFPNFFRQFFAEGAFNAAFVPSFSGVLASEGQDEAKKLAKNIFSFLTLSLLIFCAIVIIFMDKIIHIIAPGFSNNPEKLALCIQLVQITFPYLFFVSLTALLSGILNSFNKFALAAAIPITANVFMISAALSYDWINISPVVALSASLTLSGIAQLIILYFAVKKIGFGYLLAIPRLTKATIKILKLMIPGSISTGIMQINLLISMILASTLPTGSLSYLFYADRLNQLPLALFGISIGTALLPDLSKLWQKNKMQEAFALQESAFLLSLQLAVPSAIALFILSEPIVDLIFGHGKFGQTEIANTAPALSAFAIGLPAYTMGKVLTTVFFANKDTSTPVKVALLSFVINIFLTITLMKMFNHVGMALATSLSAWINSLLLIFILNKKNIFKLSVRILRNITKIIFLSGAMGIMVYYLKKILFIPNETLFYDIFTNATLVLTGFCMYLIGAYFMNFFQDVKPDYK